MLPKAGQMAGLIRLKFFVDTQGWPGGVIGNNIESNFLFLKNFIFYFFTGNAGSSANRK